ncbi:MAG: aspartate--tRNA ligase [bacterium]|nr:aspartate--tRNA ligase [bacterium]
MKNMFIEEIVGKVGEEVELYGWVDSKRDHKKIVFIDLRDRTGVVQIVGGEEFKQLSSEDVIYIKGLVKKRPEKLVNPKIKTGTVEIEAKELKILGKSKVLPLPVNTEGYDIDEEVRLKYRYLDLRRPRMTRNIILRSKLIRLVREHLTKKGFIEIETPLLTKSTPEGSRDFLVPSRLHPGKFYALPQSPQQYKQLLMTAGFERYFQIARCIRDEDSRADRGFEHTQIDIEMSFVEREDVMKMDEELITSVVEEMGYKIKQKPFPMITYQESMKKYGADKFDMRTEEDKKNGILAFAWVIDFPFFEKTDTGGWTFTHNPFSAPLPKYKEQLLKKENIGGILTSQYDLVCNGYEVGGGSIRGHEPQTLQAVFEIMGYKKEEIVQKFGHMLEAFEYGTPPHGGLAHGIERLLMTILNEKYLREVVAFPMTSGGHTSVMDAPSEVSDDQLKEVGLKIRK